MLVKQKLLNRALALARGIAPSGRPLNPLWTYLYLEGREKELVIRTANEEMDLEVRLPAMGEEGGPVLVPASPFIRAVENAPGDEDEEDKEVIILIQEGQVEVRAWPWRATINAAGPEGFPAWPESDTALRTRMDAQDLLRALSQVRYAVSRESWRAIFRGVQLEFSDRGFRAVASDGYRLALFDLERPQPFTKKAVVPARSVDELMRVLRGAEGEVDLAVGTSTMTMAAWQEKGVVRIAVRLMPGEFPDYERVIPKEFPLTVTLEAEPFREALKRVSILANKENHRVDLSLEGKRALLFAEGDYGKGQEEIPVSLEGAPMSLAYDARHFLDAVSRVEGEVVMRFSGQFTPTLIEPADGSGYLAVVVPLKV
ncbi:DNA polymerase III subunit beta [Thermus aquaticus]|uniref:DNA polymerase III beta clamp processivity factor n=1 Tax=Thermus aquaticus (strain ATCC BAA-2747 / Y51MC23) TaxID=498848 RepID=A0ABN4IGB4_THEA5|nr:DNA polymerase III subunit beta [Thermus aquaticus]ALJ90044.1 DNA polymerase III beta clamp processivity factor [Thermus aquaticus Y51MC23]